LPLDPVRDLTGKAPNINAVLSFDIGPSPSRYQKKLTSIVNMNYMCVNNTLMNERQFVISQAGKPASKLWP